MLNSFKEIDWRPSRADLTRFSRRSFRGTGVALVVVAGLSRFAWPGLTFLHQLEVVLGITTALGVLGMMHPSLARPLYWLIHVGTAAFAFLISNLALAGFYFLFLTPIAAVLRLRGRDELRLRSPGRTSLWQDHKSPVTPRRYYRQF